MDMDLNIKNYNLNEILQLFHLDYNFGEPELKQAKRVVLKTHPDKSKLPKEYFLFYSKAYKMVYQIYEFRNKMKCARQNTEYDSQFNTDKISEHSFNEMIKNMNKKEKFHNWFNRLFDQYYVRDDDNGHGEWLKSEDDRVDTNISNRHQLHDYINEVKANKREMYALQNVGLQDTMAHLSTGSTSLGNQTPNEYMCNQNQLVGNDLKQAHAISVIPVTNEDYESRKQYNNVFELQRERKNTNINPLSENQSSQILHRQREQETVHATNVAYELMKQTEENQKNQDLFWSHLKMLQN